MKNIYKWILSFVVIVSVFIVPSNAEAQTTMTVLVRRNGVTTQKVINFASINTKIKAQNANKLREQGKSIATPGSYGTCQISAQICPDPWPYLDQVNGCAGWRFAKNFTATAAHCVFNRSTGTFNSPTYVYNARGNTVEYACTVRSVTIPANYPTSTGLQNDWALIENDCPANAVLGWYGFFVAPIPLYNAPLMRHHGYNSGNYPFYSEGLFSSHSEGAWRTSAFVQPGFSGGPVKGLDPIFGYASYCLNAFPGCSIGIHSGGAHTYPGATAYRIDDALFGVMMSFKYPKTINIPSVIAGSASSPYMFRISPLNSPVSDQMTIDPLLSPMPLQ